MKMFKLGVILLQVAESWQAIKGKVVPKPISTIFKV